jgi:hypothetical protein
MVAHLAVELEFIRIRELVRISVYGAKIQCDSVALLDAGARDLYVAGRHAADPLNRALVP